MTQKEIHQKVVSLEQERDVLTQVGTFEFNPRIQEISKEIANLQKHCRHEYIDGECRFCRKLPKINN